MNRNAFPVVFDGHNDVLLRLGGPDGGGPSAFFERGDQGHLDLPRAWEGGFGGRFHPHSMPRTRCATRWPLLPCCLGSRIARTESSGSSAPLLNCSGAWTG